MKTTENTYIITYNSNIDCVVMTWTGYSTSEQFRTGTELMLEALTKHKSSKVLADIREMDIIGIDDQHWLENNFIPRAISNGFRSLAIVQPKAYFNKIAVESVSYKVDMEKLTISFFEDVEEAIKWLRTL
jgi:hypothetical protein